MKQETINSDYEQRRIVAYLDSFPPVRVLRDRQVRLASRRGMLSHKGVILQSARRE